MPVAKHDGSVEIGRCRASMLYAMTESVSLGELADQLDVLEVQCTKCDRRGRYRTATLVERHGLSIGVEH